ncbi:peptidase U32 family protein [Streptococcus caprae]|uniref:Peptidase U32 family protein n=1 Tax=Streptococcus caprae TaxID=1640501 RepID=A0ABV8CY47_9STRE
MKTITITATAESLAQAEQLLALGVDRLYIGERAYGLRLPQTLTLSEIRKIAELAHSQGKEVTIAVNALMHQAMMDALPDYLDFLEEIKADYITVGDAGVFYICKRDKRPFKTIYDASTMVTSSRQINFWGKQAGASEAVLAREIPSAELFVMAEKLEIPGEILVYGASIIHHSKRPLLQNYYNFIKTDEGQISKERDLFLAEPGDPESHHSVYEDNHGTHIFANNDLNMMTKLEELVGHGFDHWKLDGVYCPGQNFVDIVACFTEARDLLYSGVFTEAEAQRLSSRVQELHPVNRGLDTGFYDYAPDRVK